MAAAYDGRLHLAIAKGDKDAARAAIDRGDDVDLRWHHATPLEICFGQPVRDRRCTYEVAAHDLDTAALLLLRGAGVSSGAFVLACKTRTTPVNAALMRMLVQHVRETSSPDQALQLGLADCALSMFKAPPAQIEAYMAMIDEFEYGESEGQTVLMRVARLRVDAIRRVARLPEDAIYWRLVRALRVLAMRLLERGADLSALDNEGRTAYYFAVQEPQSCIVNVLERAAVKKAWDAEFGDTKLKSVPMEALQPRYQFNYLSSRVLQKTSKILYGDARAQALASTIVPPTYDRGPYERRGAYIKRLVQRKCEHELRERAEVHVGMALPNAWPKRQRSDNSTDKVKLLLEIAKRFNDKQAQGRVRRTANTQKAPPPASLRL